MRELQESHKSVCPDNCVDCSSRYQCTSCLHGFYINSTGGCSRNISLLTPTIACIEDCWECSNSNSCNVCSLTHSLYQGQCLKACPQGFFYQSLYNSTAANISISCQPCSSNCKSCSLSADECDECEDTEYKEITNYSKQAGTCKPKQQQHVSFTYYVSNDRNSSSFPLLSPVLPSLLATMN